MEQPQIEVQHDISIKLQTYGYIDGIRGHVFWFDDIRNRCGSEWSGLYVMYYGDILD